MTVSIISDLHCQKGDYGDLPPSFDEKSLQAADVLVVAGDIAIRDTRDFFCDRLNNMTSEGKFKDIVLVYGNHDYYTLQHMTNGVIKPSVSDNFVESVYEEIDGKPSRVVDFICTTLWSPIKHNELITRSLNDYNYIPEFTTQRCTELFFENLEWLEKQVEFSREEMKHDVVIVTHHLPRRELIDPMFTGNEVNEAFCVLDEDAEKRLAALAPMMWIHGHSHNFMDVTIDGVRYVRNPYGYDYSFRKEATGYKHNFIVTI